MQHQLKCWPPYFAEVMRGVKTFEIRKADRRYRVGDDLELLEWVPDGRNRDIVPPKGSYTGRCVKARVTSLLEGDESEAFGLQPGYVAMSLDVQVVWDGVMTPINH